MKKIAAGFGLALLLAPCCLTSAHAFPPPGPWDSQAMDAPIRAPASIGATIAMAEARVNARNRAQSDRTAVGGPGRDPVQESCSLQIGSVNMPSRGSMSGQTVVANADVRGTIIQICR